MELTVTLAIITIAGTLAGITGYFLMRAKFLRELAISQKRSEELASKAYETAVLAEIGQRIGYSLDGAKIVEIISGSLEQLLDYSTVSYMILPKEGGKIPFVCNVREAVARSFVREVREKMMAAVSEMMSEPITNADVDESIAGAILDEGETAGVESFFNLPIVISQNLVGLITVASREAGHYAGEETDVLYRIAKQASEAVSRLQEVLESEKGKLSQSVESLADGVLMVDTNYQVIIANRRLCQLLGIGQNPKIFDVVNALSGNFDIRTRMEEATARDEPLSSWEITIGDKVLQVSVSRVGDSRGKVLGVVVLFHDISDAKNLERLRQDFMAVMVHELRTPLTSIKSTVEMIKSGGLALKGQDLARYIKTIDSTSETMLELVNDLLDMAKLEAGKFDVICDSGDLAEILAERVEGFKTLAQAKNLAITLSLEKDLPKGWFDKVRIKQVLNNLLSNAVKYTDSGEIRVSARREVVEGSVIDILVSIADTGIGIEPEQVGRLFAKFGQLETGRAKAGLKSSGLGLYITKKVVEESGGKIWVESGGAGRGSTFYFTVLAKDIASRRIKSETSEKVAQA